MLDGIGKSLDPRFDISEIAAPYARELLLEGNPVGSKLQKDFLKGWANQVRSRRAGAALDGRARDPPWAVSSVRLHWDHKAPVTRGLGRSDPIAGLLRLRNP